MAIGQTQEIAHHGLSIPLGGLLAGYLRSGRRAQLFCIISILVLWLGRHWANMMICHLVFLPVTLAVSHAIIQ